MESQVHGLEFVGNYCDIHYAFCCSVVGLNRESLLWPAHLNQDLSERDYFWAVINRAPSSASAVEVRKILLIWSIVRIGPFQRGSICLQIRRCAPRPDFVLSIHYENLRQSGPPGSCHWLGIKFHHRGTWLSNREAGGLHHWLLQ